ncbi:MAG: S-ribosylhomocysteine lyase [Oscillospiraceae bacterium]|nr:S-ribosylhomocysteine lyase [Oscillospiraceae bacterium]
MKGISSFEVDHRKLKPGLYISRIDGDVTTYDMRFRRPNIEDLMTNSELHSTEHLFATFIRNSEIGNRIIYFGPMGCQTGFYLLVRDSEHEETIKTIKEILKNIINYEGEMPGASEIECGNFRNLDVGISKIECEKYYEMIKDIIIKDLDYEANFDTRGNGD